MQAGGPFINMQLGHRDSVGPAEAEQVKTLPAPNADVNTLLNTFAASGKGFDAIEVVALSGAHTVGKARCSSFSDRTNRPNPNDNFAKELAQFCVGDKDRQRNLDEITPDSFDNRYFVDLINRKGVLTSDQGLANHDRTGWIVGVFANDQGNFFEKFAKAMEKMSRMTSPGGVKARRNCLKRDAGVNLQTTVAAAGSGDDDEGLAASA
jgi:peroxidase